MTGRTLSTWQGDDGREYRLRVMNGEAVIDRRLSERGPWRPMPYPRALSNRIAELTAGRQWREAPMPKEEKACQGCGTWPGDPCLCKEEKSMSEGRITTAKTASGDVAVYLENRRVGTVIATKGGHAYVPAGQPRAARGNTYPTVAEVLESLSWS